MPAKKASKTKSKAAKKPAKKTAGKTAVKTAAKKKPHLKLVPKPKKQNIGDVFRQLLEQKQQRRQENSNGWMTGNNNTNVTQFDNRKHAQFGRYNGPRRKAA
ncbi:MAG TPA: hypothetical protein VM432_02905 [Bdellovibrionales bacterium]|nr:hypothetical protein [Bdellovibrionales bacterium]